MLDEIGPAECVVDSPHDTGNAVDGVQALVWIHFAGSVRIGGNLPSAHIDCLQSRLYLLNCLVPARGSKSLNVFILLQEFPESDCPGVGERTLDFKRATEPQHVSSSVRAFDTVPPGVVYPRSHEFG